MITGDYQLMFEDYLTGDMITLGDAGDYCSVRFDGIGSAELRTSEREKPSEDGISFGYEFLGKRTWTISGSVKPGEGSVPGDASTAWDSVSKLMRAWDFNRARLTPRAVVPLYFKRPGRELMVVYGRPERIDPDPTQSYVGFVSYQASFRQSDPKFYSDAEQTMVLTASQPYVGGILLNEDMDAFQLPFTTTATTSREGVLITGGDIESAPIITFEGPSSNPKLQLLNNDDSVRWTMTLLTTLGSDDVVTIDPRLWARTVLRNDGASLAGSLRGPRLAEILVPPGNNEFVYTASSSGGTSNCTIKLRNAWGAI